MKTAHLFAATLILSVSALIALADWLGRVWRVR